MKVFNKASHTEVIEQSDMIDMDNAVMRISSKNLKKYLEHYSCKTAEELCDLLWYDYGIFCKVVNY